MSGLAKSLAHLGDCPAHRLGMHPLPFLHVHGLPGGAGGEQQVRLA
jgi:hypothetical protein